MKVSNEVLAVLDRAEVSEDRVVLTGGQLDRKLYVATNKVLEAAGGKWNRRAKAHIFDGSAEDAIENILLTGEITTRQEAAYFPTPLPIVKRLIELADIKPGMLVLEPSAGTGNIAREVADITSVDCIELSSHNVERLIAEQIYRNVWGGYFHSFMPEPIYDRVVMNPPFAKQADIHHVNHALNFLKPDGLLVSVMSAGVTFRENKLTVDFRELLRQRGGYIEGLPDGAFKESGTMVRTVIVRIPGPEYRGEAA